MDPSVRNTARIGAHGPKSVVLLAAWKGSCIANGWRHSCANNVGCTHRLMTDHDGPRCICSFRKGGAWAAGALLNGSVDGGWLEKPLMARRNRS